MAQIYPPRLTFRLALHLKPIRYLQSIRMGKTLPSPPILAQADPTPLAVAVTEVDSTQAQQTVATADAQATDRTVEELGLPDLGGRQTPSPAAIGSALTNVRQQVINAVRARGSQP